jgi:methylthioribose-1-phosphate isomerase
VIKDLVTTALKIKEEKLLLLDQTLLPHQEEWVLIDTPEKMIGAIKSLKVRGAPLIGVSAGLFFGLYLVKKKPSYDEVKRLYKSLRDSRPTAVNLMNELDLLWDLYTKTKSFESTYLLSYQRAQQDIAMCNKMAEISLSVLDKKDRILTHCNTGSLATAGVGTALGSICLAHQRGYDIHVYVDETRPLLQGGRLTTWELERAGVPNTLICDNMAASLMQKKLVDKVIIGADRISKNYDVANKIGSYSLAVLCKYHKIPFYVVAPTSTFDSEIECGGDIKIEQRHGDEVRGVRGHFGKIKWSNSSQTYNPAFDVTPRELITGIITENEII